jgi:hypothetical protein
VRELRIPLYNRKACKRVTLPRHLGLQHFQYARSRTPVNCQRACG